MVFSVDAHFLLRTYLHNCLMELSLVGYLHPETPNTSIRLKVDSTLAHTPYEFCCGADDVRVTHPPQYLGIAGIPQLLERLLLSVGLQTLRI